MASAESSISNGSNGLSAAQRLMQKHNVAHAPEIEEVTDEADLQHTVEPKSSAVLEEKDDAGQTPGWVPTVSTKAAGKQKAEQTPQENKPVVDTQSTESFPSLGGPKPVAATTPPMWGAKNPANGFTNGYSNASSGANAAIPSRGPQSLVGQVQPPLLTLQSKDIIPKSQLKKPLPDILKEINKKYRTNLTYHTGEGGALEFRESSKQKDAVKDQAVKDLGARIGAKTSAKVSIPRSSRAHIIGKQGATIKALQERTGARIQMPKTDEIPSTADEEDDMIEIDVEGNPMSISMARKEINSIVSDRVSSITAKSRNIPAEFYPFLAGTASALEDSHGVQIRVPPHHIWTSQPPPQKPLRGQAPEFLPAHGDNHITFAGDRAAVQAAKAQLEQRAMLIRQQLGIEQMYLNREQHQFVIGERGMSPEDFLAKTGCAIIMPGDEDEGTITIVGPPDRLQAGLEHALDLGSSMNSYNIDVSRQYKNAPVGARTHGLYVTQYLRDRGELERLGKQHKSFIETPLDGDGAAPWQLFYRAEDRQAATRAQNEINNLLSALPPSRIATVPVDPFYHAHVRKDITPRVKKDYGVHVVMPLANQSGPVLLVFEGEESTKPDYQIPRGQPSPDELRLFQQELQNARAHILDIISKQAEITSTSIDVPAIFHDKLRRFIKKEQADRSVDQIPVRVTNTGTIVTLRGPKPSVEALADKVNAFIVEAIADEKERGFTLSFDFPQKHANQLIGKGGSNIRELRDKYDVEINVKDGIVELQGPKAKAEAAKSAISALGRQWADEATYTLKVDPRFHRELIGQKGEQINKLQTRYKVAIHFPRTGKPARDDQSSVDLTSEAGRKGPRREQEADEVIVKGPTKGADGARDEILSLLQYYKDNSFTASVSVQAGQIPSLIGSRGSGMDEIRQTTGARINIPNARDIDPSTRVEIEIKGTKTQVAQAKKLIDEKKDVFDSTVIRHLDVDKKYHRALIGGGGSVLREIVVNAGGSDDRRELARTVQFPKEGAENNLIKVEGKSDIVDKIIKAMEQIVLDRENQATEVIDIPTDQHRSLIGRGGETKKDLESKFKVSIDVPRQGSGQTGIKIVGQAADVEKAKTHISGLVKGQEGETIQVPRNLHHSVSENGQFFRRLRNDHQVTVDHGGHKVPPKPTADVPKPNGAALPLITDDDQEESPSFTIVNILDNGLEGEIPWILRGSADNIPKAKSALEAAIQQALKNTTTGYLVLPDPRAYRFVIGQGGSKVNSIRKASGCKITVPKDQGSDAIEINGNAEGVEKAKELILKAVKEGAAPRGGSSYVNGNGDWE